MARDLVTVKLRVRVNRPLVYLAVAMKLAGDWLLARAVKVGTSGA